MVKAIITTITAIVLCVGFFIWTHFYLYGQFDEFHGALQTLYAKVEKEDATREDAYAVKKMWENKKSRLQILVPHNDISYLDYWLSEACGLIYNEKYELALGKIEVLLEITKNLPDAYTLNLENVF